MPAVRWLGRSIESLSNLGRVLVVGSNLRKDHPLFALRIRQAIRKGAQVHAIGEVVQDWAMPLTSFNTVPPQSWVLALAQLAQAIAEQTGVTSPVSSETNDAWRAVATSLLSGQNKAVLIGNAAAHHQKSESLLAGQLDR